MCVNRQQLNAIDYLKEEKRVPRKMLGEQRLRITEAQRRPLAGGTERRRLDRDARYTGGLAP